MWRVHVASTSSPSSFLQQCFHFFQGVFWSRITWHNPLVLRCDSEEAILWVERIHNIHIFLFIFSLCLSGPWEDFQKYCLILILIHFAWNIMQSVLVSRLKVCKLFFYPFLSCSSSARVKGKPFVCCSSFLHLEIV